MVVEKMTLDIPLVIHGWDHHHDSERLLLSATQSYIRCAWKLHFHTARLVCLGLFFPRHPLLLTVSINLFKSKIYPYHKCQLIMPQMPKILPRHSSWVLLSFTNSSKKYKKIIVLGPPMLCFHWCPTILIWCLDQKALEDGVVPEGNRHSPINHLGSK